MSTDAPRGMASIILPCWNQIEFTRPCIAALRRFTRKPWELIVIDNRSTDHTDVYLAGVRDSASFPVTVITNAANRGFPAAINQGLEAARGEYLVMLNNDVVVTEGWLGQLIGLVNARNEPAAGGASENGGADSVAIVPGPAEFAPAPIVGTLPSSSAVHKPNRPIGLVGPMSNYAAPPQLVEDVPYPSSGSTISRRPGTKPFRTRPAITLDPEDAELWHRKGLVHRHRGESAEAERCWRRILGLKRPEKFCSFDQGIYGHIPRHNLAVLAAERGDYAEAERLWKEVLAECPGDRAALAWLGRPANGRAPDHREAGVEA